MFWVSLSFSDLVLAFSWWLPLLLTRGEVMIRDCWRAESSGAAGSVEEMAYGCYGSVGCRGGIVLGLLSEAMKKIGFAAFKEWKGQREEDVMYWYAWSVF
ncbi:hypothetical protein SADUNF_SadunfUnG0003300 [Salix dunnii]|uniref:Uncharacterized protein n=1 Tax=Salix dunnii TaxID=1413687 RepID=A0A835IZE0_9ROSI|nr:hypothetical protein SADUNF_SadunfUnG0003300 [Salix dunnii]